MIGKKRSKTANINPRTNYAPLGKNRNPLFLPERARTTGRRKQPRSVRDFVSFASLCSLFLQSSAAGFTVVGTRIVSALELGTESHPPFAQRPTATEIMPLG